jgi:hypothetical protein
MFVVLGMNYSIKGGIRMGTSMGPIMEKIKNEFK